VQNNFQENNLASEWSNCLCFMGVTMQRIFFHMEK
jgi:hypothetical protein